MQNWTFVQKSRFFQTVGILFLVLAFASIAYGGVIGGVGTIVGLVLSFVCAMQIRCPICKERFGVNLSPKKICYCPRCGRSLQDGCSSV